MATARGLLIERLLRQEVQVRVWVHDLLHVAEQRLLKLCAPLSAQNKINAQRQRGAVGERGHQAEKVGPERSALVVLLVET